MACERYVRARTGKTIAEDQMACAVMGAELAGICPFSAAGGPVSWPNRGAALVAVEAKSGNTFTEAWCKGLRAVAALQGLRRRLIVYPHGPVLRTTDGIEVVPFHHFAAQLATNAL